MSLEVGGGRRMNLHDLVAAVEAGGLRIDHRVVQARHAVGVDVVVIRIPAFEQGGRVDAPAWIGSVELAMVIVRDLVAQQPAAAAVTAEDHEDRAHVFDMVVEFKETS